MKDLHWRARRREIRNPNVQFLVNRRNPQQTLLPCIDRISPRDLILIVSVITRFDFREICISNRHRQSGILEALGGMILAQSK